MLRSLTQIQKTPLENELALVLVAAGYSSRMKAFKPLLPFGNSTVIETAIDTFQYAGINNIIVVIGYQADKLKLVLNKKGIGWVYNEKYNEGMYSSVLTGVRALPESSKGFFLLPSDMPLIMDETIEKISKAYWENRPDIVYPVFKGRRGHPPLISATLFPEILKHDGTEGLKGVLGQYRDNACHVEVEDEGVLLDMDTYDEYLNLYNKSQDRLQAYMKRALEL